MAHLVIAACSHSFVKATPFINRWTCSAIYIPRLRGPTSLADVTIGLMVLFCLKLGGIDICVVGGTPPGAARPTYTNLLVMSKWSCLVTIASLRCEGFLAPMHVLAFWRLRCRYVSGLDCHPHDGLCCSGILETPLPAPSSCRASAAIHLG